MSRKILILSGHDYRTGRKASMHYIAAALTKIYDVSFLSVGFSPLTRLVGKDPRISLDIQSNAWADSAGVSCFLDSRPFYPGGLGGRVPKIVSDALFRFYLYTTPNVYAEAIDDSEIVIIESGIAVTYLEYVLDRAKNKTVIYIASDDLRTINTAPFLIDMLARNIGRLSAIRVPSSLMSPYFTDRGGRVRHIPHGLSDPRRPGVANPFEPGLNAVSVGSMLFDPEFFEIAGKLRPDIQFHIIGSGSFHTYAQANVRVYPEMPQEETLAYLNHADFGIAPYRNATAPYYLVDTSMKLMQYQHVGLPAVCPFYAAGNTPGRFGYTPGDPATIYTAVQDALACGPDFPVPKALTWDDVATRIVEMPLMADDVSAA